MSTPSFSSRTQICLIGIRSATSSGKVLVILQEQGGEAGEIPQLDLHLDSFGFRGASEAASRDEDPAVSGPIKQAVQLPNVVRTSLAVWPGFDLRLHDRWLEKECVLARDYVQSAIRPGRSHFGGIGKRLEDAGNKVLRFIGPNSRDSLRNQLLVSGLLMSSGGLWVALTFQTARFAGAVRTGVASLDHPSLYEATKQVLLGRHKDR